MQKFHFKKDDKVFISFGKKASSRTKGRVRDHGPHFVFFRDIPSFLGPGTLSYRSCVLVGSLSTGWSGWLPLDEIEVKWTIQNP